MLAQTAEVTMKPFSIAIAVVFALFISTQAHAQETHFRLLLHGAHTDIAESGLGVSGWIISPSLDSAPDKWLGIAGPRFDAENWNFELMGGGVVNAGEITPLIDFRFEMTPGLWNIPLYIWGNAQVVFPGDNIVGYSYLQIDWVLPEGVGLIGLETENTYQPGDDDLSFGPQIVLPMGGMALIGAYQFHAGEADDQLWLRAVLNL